MAPFDLIVPEPPLSKKTVAVAICSLSVIAFAGATTYSSKVANRVLDEIAIEAGSGKSLISLQQVRRDSGLVRSSGVYSLAFDSSCMGGDLETPELPAQIRYSIGHMPDAKRLASYVARVELTGEAGQAFESVAGQDAVMLVEGEMGFDGQWTHWMRTPQIRLDQNGLQMTIAASQGKITGTGDGSETKFAWSLPSVSMRQDNNKIELTGLSAAGVVNDMQLGLGKQTIGIERVDLSGDVPGGTALISGLRFDYETTASEGRVSSSFQPSVDLIRAVGNTFQDLMFKVQLGGLDEQSLREINGLTRNHCQAQMDEQKLMLLEQAILRIIDRGVSFSITDLKGRQLENSFGGELIFALDDRGDGSNAPVMAVRERLTASGELSVSRNLVPAHLQEMLVEQGFMQASGEVMEANMNLSQGSLLINDAPDRFGLSDSIDHFLVMAEDSMASWHEQTLAGNGPLVSIARAARQP